MAEAPEFVLSDIDNIRAEVATRYEQLTGRTLQPAQTELLLLNTLAYRELLLREAIQYSAEQNLVAFARGLSLDFLAQLVGVTRLAASPARCSLVFNIVPGHAGVIIPELTRVATADGTVVFRTLEQRVIPEGTNTATILAECTRTGIVGNGYATGIVNNLLDPLSFVSSVANNAETDSGTDTESDELLRERIILAPGQFTNAGSRQAYAYHARTANASIVDVSVESVDPGTVQIYVLMEDGEPAPTEVLNQVLAACNDERIRPLNDLVTVEQATAVEYTIEYDITLYASADAVITLAAVQAAAEAFALRKRQKLGQDVPLSQIVEALMLSGVYDAVPSSAFANDVEVESNEFAKCTSIVLTLQEPVNE
jgi:phage-related baseplate assembly protein